MGVEKLEKDIELLKGSVKKWERVVAEGVDGSQWKDCPLCGEYFDNQDRSSCCIGCPVYERTLADCCEDTPFEDYDSAHEDSEKRAIYAAEELEFLKDLLKEYQCRLEHAKDAK